MMAILPWEQRADCPEVTPTQQPSPAPCTQCAQHAKEFSWGLLRVTGIQPRLHPQAGTKAQTSSLGPQGSCICIQAGSGTQAHWPEALEVIDSEGLEPSGRRLSTARPQRLACLKQVGQCPVD